MNKNSTIEKILSLINRNNYTLIIYFFSQTYVDYGTILFISSLEYTPDGRSLVTTVGERRFQVLERKTRDGYAVARIKFLSDEIDPDQG